MEFFWAASYILRAGNITLQWSLDWHRRDNLSLSLSEMDYLQKLSKPPTYLYFHFSFLKM